MDLGTFLLNRVIDATTPPDETEPALRYRKDAIFEMIRGYEPTDSMEGMLACHCVTLQFLSNKTMRDANDTTLEPARLDRVRAQANSISRTLLQWTTKYENLKKRNEARAAEAEAKSQPTTARPAPEPAEARQRQPAAPVTPPRPSDPSPRDEPAIHAPTQNARTAAAVTPPAGRPTATSAPPVNRSPTAAATSPGDLPSATNDFQAGLSEQAAARSGGGAGIDAVTPNDAPLKAQTSGSAAAAGWKWEPPMENPDGSPDEEPVWTK